MLGPKCTICVVMRTMQIHPSILHLITSVMLHKLKPVFAVVAKRIEKCLSYLGIY